MLRWLLPLVAVFALLGNAVSAFAAAGIVGKSECCCPDPETCKCHDHDNKPQPNSELKRCGGEAQMVTPTLVVATIIEPFEPVSTATLAFVEHVLTIKLTDRFERPETPPF